MPRKLSDVEQDALQLPLQERAILVERLLATLDAGEDTDVEELWLQEAEKRYAEYRAGRTESRPAEQVMEEARQRLHGRNSIS